MRMNGLIIFAVVAGCAGDDLEMRAASAGKADASLAPDAGRDADAGTSQADIPPEIEAVVTEAVAAYDRILEQNCACVVDAGGFATLQECLAPSASGPSWVPCGSMVLAAMDSPQTRTVARCLADELSTRADCLAEHGCDAAEQAACSPGAFQCTSDNPAVIVQLIEACPDLGLLSRM